MNELKRLISTIINESSGTAGDVIRSADLNRMKDTIARQFGIIDEQAKAALRIIEHFEKEETKLFARIAEIEEKIKKEA